MSKSASNFPLQEISDTLSSHVLRAAQNVVATHSHCSRSSGFVWRPGLIVTSDESLADDGDISLALPGGKTVAATLVGRDSTTDIALLRIDGADITPIASPQAALPKVGALAVVVGSRGGAPTTALGVVSFVGEKWCSHRGGEIDARIELDLSLHCTGEGSLVLDASGSVFGMAVNGPRRQVLVIPSSTIERVAGQLQTRGRVARGYLGLGLHPIRLDGDRGNALMVMSVEAKGPGAPAGLQQGDLITKWNGQPVRGMRTLFRALGPDSVGTSVKLDLLRSGAPFEINLTIGERPET